MEKYSLIDLKSYNDDRGGLSHLKKEITARLT